MITIENISLDFEKPILKNINFSVSSGQTVGILGKSGAGKSSLLKIIGGFLDASAGVVFFEGNRVKGPSELLVPGHSEIELVNQDFKLDAYHSVEENIREQILYLPIEIRNQWVDDLLNVLELSNIRKQKAITLSGGEKQRLAIGRALAKEPKLLLLDEPFSHLDGRMRSKLIAYLSELKSIRKMSIILVSHDGTELLGLSDKIYHLKNGYFSRKGKPENMYYSYRSLEEAKLFGHINSVLVNNKRCYFRPNEYRSDFVEKDSDDSIIKLNFVQSIFTGLVYENYFYTNRKEKVVLYGFKSMQDIHAVKIEKKVN
jgi:ABC-type multidrug transport system ATPase subunit